MNRFYIEILTVVFVALFLMACTAYTVVTIIVDLEGPTLNKKADVKDKKPPPKEDPEQI